MWVGLTADVEQLTNTLAFCPVKKHMNKLDMDVSFYDPDSRAGQLGRLSGRRPWTLGHVEPVARRSAPSAVLAVVYPWPTLVLLLLRAWRTASSLGNIRKKGKSTNPDSMKILTANGSRLSCFIAPSS